MKGRVTVLMGVLALLLPAGAFAITRFGRQARARANRDASGELMALRLPSGARNVHGDPSARGLGHQAPSCTRSYVIDYHSFWRAPGKPARVWSWIAKHPPTGYHGAVGTAGEGSPPSFVDFFWPDQSTVSYRALMVSVAAAKGGGTAIRADGVAAGWPHRNRSPCTTIY